MRPPRRPISQEGAVRAYPANVVDLGQYRALLKQDQLPTVYYLTGEDNCCAQLEKFQFMRLVVISSEEELKTRLLSHAPDLILLDSVLEWASPISIIQWLSRLIEAPIVMLSPDSGSPAIKEAFAAGVHDTLYTPLKEDELSETLEVLLKFRRHA